MPIKKTIEIRPSQSLTIPRDVMARQVGDEIVILDLASGNYFGLDSVGARIWQLLGDGKALSEISEVMLNEYEVPREQLERDINRLIQDLVARGLVTLTIG